MGQTFEVYWPGQTREQTRKTGVVDAQRLVEVLVDLGKGAPAYERLELSALAITNPEPLQASPQDQPEMWASPDDVGAAARRLADALEGGDREADALAGWFCWRWYTRGFFWRLRAVLTQFEFEGRRLAELQTLLSGRLRPDCRRHFVSALVELERAAAAAAEHGARHMTLDLGLEGYWAVDGPPSE